jgi:streptogramin lyase
MRLLLCALLLCAPFGAWAQKPAANAPTYADLLPVLKARCIVCHNQAALENKTVSGGLALDSYVALKRGTLLAPGKYRALYTPGKSGSSELIRRLKTTSPTLLMPKGGPPLTPAQIALFARWVDGGAQPGKSPVAPVVTSKSPAELPMPANLGTLDLRLRTQIAPTPDLLKSGAPKEAALEFALRVGPLPPITALAFSPDGKRLAVGGYRAVTVWDTEAGRPVGCLTGLSGSVLSLAFSPDGKHLAAAGGAPAESGEVRIYDLGAKTLGSDTAFKTLAGHSDVVYSVAWSPEGTRLATGSQDRTARLWEWPSGKELKVLRDHSEAVTRVGFAPDGKSLYTASQDHNLRRTDASTGEAQRVFNGHGQPVLALAIKPDGSRILSSGVEPRLRWWNPDDGNTINYSDGHSAQVNELVFSKDGSRIASASADNTVRVWDGNGGFQRALEGASDWLYAVALSPDGRFVTGAGAEGIVYLWETETGRLRLRLLAWPPVRASDAPEWAALTPEGYFDASLAWAAKLRLLLAGKPVAAPQLAGFLPSLRQPENVLKSWQGAALDPAKLPEK